MGNCLPSSQSEDSPQAPAAAAASDEQTLTLVSSDEVNHNTKLFTFDSSRSLSLAGSTWAIGCRAPIGEGGTDHTRMYTPVAFVGEDTAKVQLLVKVYEQGIMSTHIHSLAVGDKVSFVGPKEKLAYSANKFTQLGLVAAGTGLTPMLQLIELVLSNEADQTQLHLLYLNTAERDILLREKLDEWVSAHPSRLAVTHLLSRPESDSAATRWRGETVAAHGDLAGAIKALLPLEPSDAVKVCVCGPPGMVEAVAGAKGEGGVQGAAGGVLAGLGFTTDMIYKF